MISKEQIEARLADLQGGLAELMANVQATRGAIQDCEYWLAQIAEADKNPSQPAYLNEVK